MLLARDRHVSSRAAGITQSTGSRSGTRGTVIVTGATGNVGRALVHALLAAGESVRALVTPRAAGIDPFPDAHAHVASGQLSIVPFDFTDPASFDDALINGRPVAHASLFLLRPPAISDVERLIPALEVAVSGGVRRVVFLSIQGAARNPIVPHYAIERYLEQIAARQSGMTYTFLRSAFFMQNLSTTHAADIRELSEVLVPAGEGRTAFVDVRDIADAAVRALTETHLPTHANRAYELTGREALTYAEVATILSQVLGRPIAYRRPSALRFYRHMRARGHPRAYVAVMLALYSTARFGLAAHLSPELEQLLKRAPITFAQFARDHAGAWE